MFMTERAIRRFLKVREHNTHKNRPNVKLIARIHSDAEIEKAKVSAVGYLRNDPRRSIATYIERRDIKNIKKFKEVTRISAVHSEVMLSDHKELTAKIEEPEYDILLKGQENLQEKQEEGTIYETVVAISPEGELIEMELEKVEETSDPAEDPMDYEDQDEDSPE